MDTEAYIGSGNLEAYALGALSPEERLSVEAAIARHPELAAALAAIELTLYEMAQATGEAPPTQLQQQIWERLEADRAATETAKPEEIPFTKQERRRQVQWQQAAVWIALVGSMLANFVLWFQRNSAEHGQTDLIARLDSMHSTAQGLTIRVDALEEEKNILLAAGMETIVLRPKKPTGLPSGGMLHYHPSRGEAYLSLHNMADPNPGKEYQLWIATKNQPTYIGALSAEGMQRLTRPISAAEKAFISLGNASDTTSLDMGSVVLVGEG